MRTAQAHGNGSEGGTTTNGRRFPRWWKSKVPHCPKHPHRAMKGKKERAPTFALGGFRHGKRMIYHCVVEGCRFVALGETEIYRGESISELGTLEGV
jgi:hypothetical protein